MENYEEFRCDLFICVVERAQRLRFHRIGEQLPHPYWNTRCDCDLSGKFIFTCFKNRIVFIQWFYLRFHQSMDPHWKHFPFVRFRLFVRAKRHFESYRIILFFYFEFTKCANVNIIFWSVRSLSVRHCDNMRLEFFFFFLIWIWMTNYEWGGSYRISSVIAEEIPRCECPVSTTSICENIYMHTTHPVNCKQSHCIQ